jgi:ribonuclease HII
MDLIIGIDEAGYGPNLGPLVIASSAWIVPPGFSPDAFWKQLTPVVKSEQPKEAHSLWVADSKELYSPQGGVDWLERGVICFLNLLHDQLPAFYAEFKQLLIHEAQVVAANIYPWLHTPALTLPTCILQAEIDQTITRLQPLLRKAEITPARIAVKILQPDYYNQLLEQYGNKGQVLSLTSLQLVREQIEAVRQQYDPQQIHIFCDKHGGRNYYASLISDVFPESMPMCLEESQQISRYQVGNQKWQFSVGSERYFPVALASMVAKYMRELEMHLLNDYWGSLIPNLKRTQGYPNDARRFWNDIEPSLTKQSLQRAQLWRNK